MAVEAVLLILGKISEEGDTSVSIRLLVPSKVIGCIIGKSGSVINEIRKITGADIQIFRSDKPKGADVNVELVEVWMISQKIFITFLLSSVYLFSNAIWY